MPFLGGWVCRPTRGDVRVRLESLTYWSVYRELSGRKMCHCLMDAVIDLVDQESIAGVHQAVLRAARTA
jgi:hypothetical protein